LAVEGGPSNEAKLQGKEKCFLGDNKRPKLSPKKRNRE
jgi:hypothetical protein